MSFSAHYNLPPLPSTANLTRAKSSAPPVSDVLMFHTTDGGEIEFVNGQPTMSDGLATFVYLAMFGGNVLDSGLSGDDRKQWWGNLSETDPARTYRSRTQNLLATLVPIPANLRRLEDAAKSDLSPLLTIAASSITATASMPALNQVTLDVAVVINNVAYEYSFTRPWGARAK